MWRFLVSLLVVSAAMTVPAATVGVAVAGEVIDVLPYAEGDSTTLQIVVQEPLPPTPIMDSDVIRLLAYTPEDVFPGGRAFQRSSSFSIDGLHIDWSISSWPIIGGSTPESKPLICSDELGPLPAGTYELTASWTHTGDGLLVGAPSSGTGTLCFTVVPEPSTCATLAVSVLVTLCSLRCRPTAS